MQIGVFADTHDHLENLRAAVDEFNRRQCDLVVFAGDLVSTFAVPPLRKLNAPLIACFGDNEGNKRGILGGFQIVGEIGEPPLGFRAADGTRLLLTHQRELLRGQLDGADIVIFAHTHKPSIRHDADGRLLVNPGEVSGWTYGQPTIALLDTTTRTAELIALPRASSPESGNQVARDQSRLET